MWICKLIGHKFLVAGPYFEGAMKSLKEDWFTQAYFCTRCACAGRYSYPPNDVTKREVLRVDH